MWLNDPRSRNFTLQLAFVWIYVCLSGPTLCPFKIETFSMEKTGNPLIFAPSVYNRWIIAKKCYTWRILSIFPSYWHRHDDFENFLMHILKIELFYPPVDGVPTQLWNNVDVNITICDGQTLFFASFFRSRRTKFLRQRNSILATDLKSAHSKILGYPFQDELLLIRSFFIRFETRKIIMDFWALMG